MSNNLKIRIMDLDILELTTEHGWDIPGKTTDDGFKYSGGTTSRFRYVEGTYRWYI